jgi:hypothetical protein
MEVAYYDMVTITAVKSFIVQAPVRLGAFEQAKLLSYSLDPFR